MARFCALFSGSSGNCTYVGGAGAGVLVDAGVSCRSILTALSDRELDAGSIAGILVTHEHVDHIRGLRVLLKRLKVPVYSAAATLEFLLTGGHVPPEADLRELKDTTEIGGMEITPFATSHDGVSPLGFRIHTADDRLAGIATDLGVVTDGVDQALRGCDLVLLESNYDKAMLSCGPYPYYLKRRIMSQVGHLSNEACAAQLEQLASGGSTRFVLGHLSKENNMPDLAFQTARSVLSMAGLREDVDFTLQVARRCEPSPLLVF